MSDVLSGGPGLPGAPCPDCGALLGGSIGCDRAFLELGARAAADVAFAYRRRAVVDAYCLQHPAYIRSLKSFAAHLCGMCAAVERSEDARAERSIWSNLRLPPGAVKPDLAPVPALRTVIDVYLARTPQIFRDAADAWIADVWASWVEYHALARRWLDYSIEAPRRVPR